MARLASFVAIISAIAGYAGSMYYTALLYGKVPWSEFMAMLISYCVWLLLVMALTVAMSAAFRTAIAATITVILIPIGLIIDTLIGSFWKVTPWKMANYGVLLLTDGIDMKTYWATCSSVIFSIIVACVIGIWLSKKRISDIKI